MLSQHRLSAHDFDMLAAGFGSAETVARKIARTVQTLNVDRFDLKYSAGTLPHERQMRAIELYASEVLPRVRKRLAVEAVASLV